MAVLVEIHTTGVRFLDREDGAVAGRSEPFSSTPPPKTTMASKRSDGVNCGGWYQDSSDPISGVAINGLDSVTRRKREDMRSLRTHCRRVGENGKRAKTVAIPRSSTTHVSGRGRT